MGLCTKLMVMAPAANALLSAGTGDASFDVTTIMADSVKSMQGQMFAVLAIVVPAIVAVVAATVGVKYGIGWLRKMKSA